MRYHLVPVIFFFVCIDFRHGAGLRCVNLDRMSSSQRVHVLGRLWCEVRPREGRSPLVSDLFSQCPPHISAGWQPFGAITCQAVTDLRVMCSVHAEGFFFVWSGGEVCAGSKLRASVEAWTGRRKMCSGWWDAGFFDVGVFWRKWKNTLWLDQEINRTDMCLFWFFMCML